MTSKGLIKPSADAALPRRSTSRPNSAAGVNVDRRFDGIADGH
jgi:hypothetical protein